MTTTPAFTKRKSFRMCAQNTTLSSISRSCFILAIFGVIHKSIIPVLRSVLILLNLFYQSSFSAHHVWTIHVGLIRVGGLFCSYGSSWLQKSVRLLRKRSRRYWILFNVFRHVFPGVMNGLPCKNHIYNKCGVMVVPNIKTFWCAVFNDVVSSGSLVWWNDNFV